MSDEVTREEAKEFTREQVKQWMEDPYNHRWRMIPLGQMYIRILDERDRRDRQLARVAEAAGVETPMQLTALAENDEQTTADLLAVFVRRLRDERDQLRERLEAALGARNSLSQELKGVLRSRGFWAGDSYASSVITASAKAIDELRARNEKLEAVLQRTFALLPPERVHLASDAAEILDAIDAVEGE